MHRCELDTLLANWFSPGSFEDSATNGLQIEGRDEVAKVICGVSANAAFIARAIDAGADALFVHHGLIWGGITRLDGWLRRRVARLLEADISLFAYHLPLDAHPRLGNNAGLADALGLGPERAAFGEYKGQLIGVSGSLASPAPFSEMLELVRVNVGTPHFSVGAPDRPIRRVAVCSGGAPDLLYEAIDRGFDLFLTGEATEWVKAVAEESGVAFIAAGHHATERFGVRRVAEALGREEGISANFIDIPNPL